jgi:RimJ/RimL family protein N-acetyltransferase
MELMNTPKWLEHIGDRGIRTISDAKAYIQDKMHPDLACKGFVNYVMTEKSSGVTVGTCSIHDRKGVDGLDIGYALLPKFEGQGYAYEAANAMLQLIFGKYAREKASAITTTANTDSCKLLEKLDFQLQGHITLQGDHQPLRLYVRPKDR